MRPTDSGVGSIRAIQNALKEAGVKPDQIDVFNCHATSTPKGDQSEANCIRSILAAGKDIDQLTAEQIS